MTVGNDKRILLIASGGGHWTQLLLMLPPLEGYDVKFLTTIPGLPEQSGVGPSRIIPDCSSSEKHRIPACVAALTREILIFRPHIVISTGALPGLMGIIIGRLIGARTVWVDSVANAEEMSSSGRHARRFATLWLSQWEHVAKASGAGYAGSVL